MGLSATSDSKLCACLCTTVWNHQWKFLLGGASLSRWFCFLMICHPVESANVAYSASKEGTVYIITAINWELRSCLFKNTGRSHMLRCILDGKKKESRPWRLWMTKSGAQSWGGNLPLVNSGTRYSPSLHSISLLWNSMIHWPFVMRGLFWGFLPAVMGVMPPWPEACPWL